MNLEEKIELHKKVVQSITAHDDEEQSAVHVAIAAMRATIDDEEWRMNQRRQSRATELAAKFSVPKLSEEKAAG